MCAEGAPKSLTAEHADRGASPAAGRSNRAARLLVSSPILAYQKVISPGLPRRCRYEPTCSRYAVQAIGEYGILRGLVLAAWRLLRCNPFSPGGYDPVRAQRVFKSRPASCPTRAHQ
ncbi:MAG TPA: membrane protein insertion efficiency factor YidD [Solirubrobacteraceae bacterium]|nr:membrane protein insertion efficiency factor YidD [Solirubrobacteraceae bacterium]